MKHIIEQYPKVFLCLLLTAVTGLAYLPMGDFGFINYDDNIYVYENQHVQQGLTGEGLEWAFTTTLTGNWHPLTWLSLMLDNTLFGAGAGGYHLVNFSLHLLNTLLLFIVLNMITDSVWRCGFVAALFAIHPMHVESVAWVAERKDVLSTLFWLLTMWAYCRYARRPAWPAMALVVVLFAAGLMTKPMLVTLPCVLLLCDHWPLNRFKPATLTEILQQRSGPRELFIVLEKLPLFLLAIGSAVVTMIVQQHGSNVAGMGDLSIATRLVNAFAAYFEYVLKLFWPLDLAVLYPFQTNLPIWKPLAGAALIIACIVAAWRTATEKPYLTVGLLWYLGTFVPVVGLIQVGNHFIADRYTYIPYIGLFIVIAWGIPELFAKFRLPGLSLAGAALAVIALLLLLCRTQVGYWREDTTLFAHALAVTKDNFLIHNNMGAALTAAGKSEEAISHYQQAIAIKPDYETPLNNLGLLHAQQGKNDAAIGYYKQALAVNPKYAIAHFNLANAYVEQKKIGAALQHYRAAVEADPDYRNALYNYAMTLAKSGKAEEAIQHYRRLIRLDPTMAKAYNDMGNIAVMQKDLDTAIAYYEKAMAIDPGYADAYHNLGIAMIHKGKGNSALMYFEKAVELNPRDNNFQETLAKAREFVRQRQ